MEDDLDDTTQPDSQDKLVDDAIVAMEAKDSVRGNKPVEAVSWSDPARSHRTAKMLTSYMNSDELESIIWARHQEMGQMDDTRSSLYVRS